MDLMDEMPADLAGCQGAMCCPLASDLRKYEENVRQMENLLRSRCNRIGSLFRLMAEAVEGIF